jgi:hypothetical protein
MQILVSGDVNSGQTIYFDLASPTWANEVQMTFTPNTTTLIEVYHSLDNNVWTSVGEQISVPASSGPVLGIVIFDKPVQTQYIRVDFTLGSNIDLSAAKYKIFAPLFQTQGQLITKSFYLPNASSWDTIVSPNGSAQQYTVVDALNNSEITGITNSLSLIKSPCIYLKTINTSLDFPRTDGLHIQTLPLTENSKVQFYYHGAGLEADAYTSIRFKAVLASSDSKTTPQLTGYRVKLS